jgi:hypothetical protein
MKPYLAFAVFILVAFAACKKSNSASKIPQISFLEMAPDTLNAGSSADTLYIYFSFSDGDADLGNPPNPDGPYDIYIKDSRYDSLGFIGYYFPAIDQSIEDPNKGISGTAIFKQLAANITPRPDSIHLKNGDTLYYQLFIKDRAGHASDTITTTTLYLKP